ETILGRFIILELAAREFPLQRIARRLPALTQENAVRSGGRSHLDNDADCYLDHEEKIVKLEWKYNGEPGVAAPIRPCIDLATSRSIQWKSLALLRGCYVHSSFSQRVPMGHAVNPKAEEILDKEFKCLNAGFVRLVDYMGGDESIVQAARVSYGRGTKTVNEDRGLIRYLMRHMHTTPFEMVELKFHVKLPIFVARQWIRHRTANVNEYSGRYSVMKDEFYIPEPQAIHRQSRRNKQGRAKEEVPEELRKKVLDILGSAQRETY